MSPKPLLFSLLVALSLTVANANETTTFLSDDALRAKIAGTWQTGSSALGLGASRHLVFQDNGTIHGAIPLSDGKRRYWISLNGFWKVEQGKLVAREALSTGEQVRVVYEIIALTPTSMIVRDTESGEVSGLTRATASR